MTIDILMATYNGAKYIESQILSLFAQSYKDWRLIVHDDGSKDDTVEIIKKYAAIDSRVAVIEDELRFGDAGKNFMHLLQFSKADYIMFCDQDDIWLDNKVECHLEAIKKRNNNIPQVIYSNSYVWIPNEGIKGISTLTFPKYINQFLFLNSGMQGCVAMFNRSLCEVLKSYKGSIAMHDHILHLAALSLGEVEYLPQCLMLYRNHDSNVTGGTATTSTNYKQILRNGKIPVVDRKHYNAVLDFYEEFKSEFNNINLQKITLYLTMPKIRSLNRFAAVLKGDFQLFDSRFRLMIKMILRPYINK